MKKKKKYSSKKYSGSRQKTKYKKKDSLKQDLQALQNELSSNPSAGIDLGCGIRKIRMAIGSKNKGKSHGARVITYTYTVNDTEGIINLIYIYDKEERESITDNEIKWLVKEVEI